MIMFITIIVAAVLAVAVGLHRDLSRLEGTARGKRSRPYRAWREADTLDPTYRPRHRISSLADQMNELALRVNAVKRAFAEALLPALEPGVKAMARAMQAFGTSVDAYGDRHRTALEKARRRP